MKAKIIIISIAVLLITVLTANYINYLKFDIEKYINKILQEMKTGGHLTHLHGNHTDDTGEYRKTMYEEYGITL